MKKHPCEDCGWRKKAEAKPEAFMSKVWVWHTKFCPGWKSYQKSLENQHKDNDPVL